jgi:hypothetical protein
MPNPQKCDNSRNANVYGNVLQRLLAAVEFSAVAMTTILLQSRRR